ncbi:MAG TPA: ornithine cyclodeaminase family protein [Candidatus Omnitrophica bacterium]|nr:ornithine cyclodeaminase family protein [Candidatus Omnitrophota bacterium]
MTRPRSTLILTQSEIDRLIDMQTAIRVIREAFIAQARGETSMPPKVYLDLPGYGDFRAMPSALRRPAVCGIKWVNVHPQNQRKGLPTVMGTVILNDPATGFPLAVMDGLSVTRLRTGAAAAVAIAALARSRMARVGLVGCGAQALSQLEGLLQVRRVDRIAVWGYRRGEAARFCRSAGRRLGVTLIPVGTVNACVKDADVVITLTPSRRPLVRREWIRPGTHLNAIGADAPGKQELDPQILREAVLIVDEPVQAMHGGEINVPLRKGQLTRRAIHATLGEVLLGRAAGRTRADQITVFDSTGLAVHDVALGYAIYRAALRSHTGHPVTLFSS